MKLSDLAKTVSNIAPVLGSLLGSPFAGMGISLLADHFNTDKKDLNALAKAILQDPAKVKELEYKHKEAMQQMLMDFLQKSEVNMPKWIVGLVSLIMAAATLAYLFEGSIKLGN